MLRHRIGLFLLLAGLLALLAACDGRGMGLPSSNTTPTINLAAQVTPTVPSIAQATTVPQPTPSDNTPIVIGPTTRAIATSVPVSTGTVTTQGNSAVDAEVIQIENNAVKIRGLTPKRDVPETFINKDQMRTNITKLYETDYSREQAQHDAVGRWLFRLIDDPKMDLYQLQLDLQSNVVLGYYDPKVKDLFVLQQGSGLTGQSRSTIAHEFVHSLQDEYYDLTRLLPDKSHEYDRDNAVRALVEGDAVASEVDYVRKFFTQQQIQDLVKEESSASTATLDKAPRYIKDSLYFPYIQSGPFIEALRSKNGFQGVNDALADPPQSSEQILHPEKYLGSPRDVPVVVTVPPLTSTLTTLDPNWKYIDGGSFGEFDMQLQLKINGVSETEANQAAAGWGGAWYVQYQSGDSGVLALDTRWDTANDASEFNNAMGKSFSGATKDGDLWVSGSRYFSVTRTDKRVLYIAASDKKALQAVLDKLK